MRVLVTGGAGYVGGHVVRLLVQHGYEPVILDNLSQGHKDSVEGIPLECADLTDRSSLASILTKWHPQAVMHFAGVALVGASMKDPGSCFRVNVGGGLNLLDAMVNSGCRSIVFSSSAAVYGEPSVIPIPEDHPKSPTNPYGESKLFFELILRRYDSAHGVRSVSLRYFNAAGADSSGEIGEDHNPETHLIPLALSAALGQREKIDLFGDDYPTVDGTCVRDYVHVSDLAEAHLLALGALAAGSPTAAYNLGNGVGFSVREVIAACEAVTGRKLPTLVRPRRAGDPAVLVAGSERAKTELGWAPKYTGLPDIVRSAWRWHSSHPKGFGDP